LNPRNSRADQSMLLGVARNQSTPSKPPSTHRPSKACMARSSRSSSREVS
jgi:hypothetical protein